jgi:hypothetical protein
MYIEIIGCIFMQTLWFYAYTASSSFFTASQETTGTGVIGSDNIGGKRKAHSFLFRHCALNLLS